MFSIANRKIGREEPPLIIAEIGINHGGDLDLARHMVTLAAKSGAECVKHQTHFVDDEMTAAARDVYPPNDARSIWQVIADAALSAEDEVALKRHAEACGLIYMSTPFSRKAADFLDSLDVPAFKIGSGECDNIPLLRHVARMGRPIIMSTGMQTVASLQRAVTVLRQAGVPFALLECTNAYPSPPETVSLKGIGELRDAFPGVEIGFSDHSIGPEMALASVALGASIVERHFTDSRYREGPDIACSMDPAELRHLIDRSREIHRAAITPKHRSAAEEPVYAFARASVVADRDLPAGHIIAETDIWVRRPGTGAIPAYEFDAVVGRTLNRPAARNQMLDWQDFE